MPESGADSLLAAARRAQARAYAPYSRVKIGAAIRTRSGAIHAGCNVENAAFPVGICAEAAAVAAMVLAGETGIEDVLVVADGEIAATPCGACRQILSEFSAASTRVHAANRTGIQATFALAELLPHAFGPAHLAVDDQSRTAK